MSTPKIKEIIKWTYFYTEKKGINYISDARIFTRADTKQAIYMIIPYMKDDTEGALYVFHVYVNKNTIYNP